MLLDYGLDFCFFQALESNLPGEVGDYRRCPGGYGENLDSLFPKGYFGHTADSLQSYGDDVRTHPF
jgi:hypothetical protein